MKTSYSNYGGNNIMPLLIGFTPTTPIEEWNEVPMSYSDFDQATYTTMAIGTRSLRQVTTITHGTRLNGNSKLDPKNEIDDKR